MRQFFPDDAFRLAKFLALFVVVIQWSLNFTRCRTLEPALRTAFAEHGPTLVDVTIDPSGYGAQLAALRGG